jgi:hypothetical protein
MATITPVSLAATGSDLTLAAATSGGDTIAAAKDAILVVDNGNGGSITVTFAGEITCSQGSTHAVAVVVAAGKVRPIPVPTATVDAAAGTAAITYSTTTSVTVAAYKRG